VPKVPDAQARGTDSNTAGSDVMVRSHSVLERETSARHRRYGLELQRWQRRHTNHGSMLGQVRQNIDHSYSKTGAAGSSVAQAFATI